VKEQHADRAKSVFTLTFPCGSDSQPNEPYGFFVITA